MIPARETIEQLVNEYQTGSVTTRTFLAQLLHKPSPIVAVVILKILREEGARAIPTITYLSNALLELHPGLSETPAVASSSVVVGTTRLQVRIDDVVQLRPKTEHAKAMLNRAGTWWKITNSWLSKPDSTRPTSWYLTSLPRKKQGLAPLAGFVNEVMWMAKHDDQDYEIINVCPFPKAFDYKDYQ